MYKYVVVFRKVAVCNGSAYREGVMNLEVNFTTGDKRSSWESTFLDAKQKLCKSWSRLVLSFVKYETIL